MIALYALVFSLLILAINAQLPGSWPPVDRPPPPVDAWTRLVDMSKVPNVPVVRVVGQNCPQVDTYCNWSCTTCTRNETDIIQCPGKSDWGLTFDDGPTEFTPPLLTYLQSQNVAVSFWVIGSRVHDNPQTLKTAYQNGNHIGVHTWSHTALTTQSNEVIIAEIKWTEYAIQQAIGVTPKYMRPPFGDMDDRVRAIMTQLGYKIVIWDKDTNDWLSGDDPSFQMSWVAGNFTQWVKENDPTGHISLEHDLYNQTAAQGPIVVPIVKGAGFNIKPVATCIGDTPYLNTAPASNSSAAPATAPAAAAAPAEAPATAPQSTTPQFNGDNSTTSSSTTSSKSNAISQKNNNCYLLSLVLFIVSFIINF